MLINNIIVSTINAITTNIEKNMAVTCNIANLGFELLQHVTVALNTLPDGPEKGI
jgi:hypothetical protein